LDELILLSVIRSLLWYYCGFYYRTLYLCTKAIIQAPPTLALLNKVSSGATHLSGDSLLFQQIRETAITLILSGFTMNVRSQRRFALNG